MFISKKRHEEVVKLLTANYEVMSQGYRDQISSLNLRIDDLRSLVFSPTRANDIPPVLEEADKIITQNEVVIHDADELSEQELRERDLIFSGEFENLVN